MADTKIIDAAPVIAKLAERALQAKGRECSLLGEVIDLLRAAPDVTDNNVAYKLKATDKDTNVLTNADRIRAMSDEELAAFLDCFGCCQHCSEHERLSDNRWFSDERCDEMCVSHCLEWLKQPEEVK